MPDRPADNECNTHNSAIPSRSKSIFFPFLSPPFLPSINFSFQGGADGERPLKFPPEIVSIENLQSDL